MKSTLLQEAFYQWLDEKGLDDGFNNRLSGTSIGAWLRNNNKSEEFIAWLKDVDFVDATESVDLEGFEDQGLYDEEFNELRQD